LTRSNLGIVRLSPTGEASDTLATYLGNEQLVHISGDGSGSITVEVTFLPFGKRPTVAMFGGDVYVGTQDAAEIRVHGQDGTLLRIVRTGRSPEPVTEAHYEAFEERRIAALPEERRAEARQRGRNSDVPRSAGVPPYGRITADAAGNLWVSDYDDPTDVPGRWTIYDPRGAVLARIVLPERFTAYDIGASWILGRELDELDVEHVRLYRLVKS
jgi:hypothetical protein